jgi:hypothetical protein
VQLPGSRTSWNRSAEKDRRGVGENKAGPGPPIAEGKDQKESSRDGGNIMTDKEEPIRDMMQEDQRPTE